MASNLVLTPESELDIADAFHWYQEQREGLGEEFLNCLEASLQALIRNPNICGVVHENYRRCLMRRFPYVVLYELSNDVVIVYAVFHTSQNPNKWRARIDG